MRSRRLVEVARLKHAMVFLLLPPGWYNTVLVLYGYWSRREEECGYDTVFEYRYDSLRNSCLAFVTAASEEKI